MSLKVNAKNDEKMDWRYRVFDSLSFPTLILKPNKVIISANRIFLETFHMCLENVVGKACHEIFFESKEPCPEDLCPLLKVLTNKSGQSVLRMRSVGDGEDIWEDRVFSPILGDDGEIIYIMESIRDVTRVKKLEKALLEAKEFLEKIIFSSPSAIMAADRKGNVLLMNKAAEELFGYTIEEIVKEKTVESIYPPGEAKKIMRALRDESYGGKGKLPVRKAKIINAKNEEVHVEMTAAIIYEGVREIATMGIYNDLTEKLEVERKLRETRAQLAQSEKMASLGQLAAGIAHEINNPLTGILFNASMAAETLEKDDANLEKMNFIIEDVNRCKEIVKNLLVYSRQVTSSKILVQIEDVVNNSLNLIHDQRLFGNIIIDKDLSKETILINVDKNQITQVLINLIMNACAAMDGEGVLTLRTYRDKAERKAYLEVEDNGCGIAEENLSKIFDPFFTTKEQGKGTGLGLSTSYGLIKENGGSIYVKKTDPAGTTFCVELPLFVPDESHLFEQGRDAEKNE
ncbi:MAG: PAS domain S-box protein [Deltaproteobacteria bacterium]|nr:PAS domain S-box protein [Deltaproteobacteria bacterium]